MEDKEINTIILVFSKIGILDKDLIDFLKQRILNTIDSFITADLVKIIESFAKLRGCDIDFMRALGSNIMRRIDSLDAISVKRLVLSFSNSSYYPKYLTNALVNRMIVLVEKLNESDLFSVIEIFATKRYWNAALAESLIHEVFKRSQKIAPLKLTKIYQVFENSYLARDKLMQLRQLIKNRDVIGGQIPSRNFSHPLQSNLPTSSLSTRQSPHVISILKRQKESYIPVVQPIEKIDDKSILSFLSKFKHVDQIDAVSNGEMRIFVKNFVVWYVEQEYAQANSSFKKYNLENIKDDFLGVVKRYLVAGNISNPKLIFEAVEAATTIKALDIELLDAVDYLSDQWFVRNKLSVDRICRMICSMGLSGVIHIVFLSKLCKWLQTSNTKNLHLNQIVLTAWMLTKLKVENLTLFNFINGLFHQRNSLPASAAVLEELKPMIDEFQLHYQCLKVKDLIAKDDIKTAIDLFFSFIVEAKKQTDKSEIYDLFITLYRCSRQNKYSAAQIQSIFDFFNHDVSREYTYYSLLSLFQSRNLNLSELIGWLSATKTVYTHEQWVVILEILQKVGADIFQEILLNSEFQSTLEEVCGRYPQIVELFVEVTQTIFEKNDDERSLFCLEHNFRYFNDQIRMTLLTNIYEKHPNLFMMLIKSQKVTLLFFNSSELKNEAISLMAKRLNQMLEISESLHVINWLEITCDFYTPKLWMGILINIYSQRKDLFFEMLNRDKLTKALERISEADVQIRGQLEVIYDTDDLRGYYRSRKIKNMVLEMIHKGQLSNAVSFILELVDESPLPFPPEEIARVLTQLYQSMLKFNDSSEEISAVYSLLMHDKSVPYVDLCFSLLIESQMKDSEIIEWIRVTKMCCNASSWIMIMKRLLPQNIQLLKKIWLDEEIKERLHTLCINNSMCMNSLVDLSLMIFNEKDDQQAIFWLEQICHSYSNAAWSRILKTLSEQHPNLFQSILQSERINSLINEVAQNDVQTINFLNPQQPVGIADTSVNIASTSERPTTVLCSEQSPVILKISEKIKRLVGDECNLNDLDIESLDVIDISCLSQEEKNLLIEKWKLVLLTIFYHSKKLAYNVVSSEDIIGRVPLELLEEFFATVFSNEKMTKDFLAFYQPQTSTDLCNKLVYFMKVESFDAVRNCIQLQVSQDNNDVAKNLSLLNHFYGVAFIILGESPSFFNRDLIDNFGTFIRKNNDAIRQSEDNSDLISGIPYSLFHFIQQLAWSCDLTTDWFPSRLFRELEIGKLALPEKYYWPSIESIREVINPEQKNLRKVLKRKKSEKNCYVPFLCLLRKKLDVMPLDEYKPYHRLEILAYSCLLAKEMPYMSPEDWSVFHLLFNTIVTFLAPCPSDLELFSSYIKTNLSVEKGTFTNKQVQKLLFIQKFITFILGHMKSPQSTFVTEETSAEFDSLIPSLKSPESELIQFYIHSNHITNILNVPRIVGVVDSFSKWRDSCVDAESSIESLDSPNEFLFTTEDMSVLGLVVSREDFSANRQVVKLQSLALKDKIIQIKNLVELKAKDGVIVFPKEYLTIVFKLIRMFLEMKLFLKFQPCIAVKDILSLINARPSSEYESMWKHPDIVAMKSMIFMQWTQKSKELTLLPR